MHCFAKIGTPLRWHAQRHDGLGRVQPTGTDLPSEILIMRAVALVSEQSVKNEEEDYSRESHFQMHARSLNVVCM